MFYELEWELRSILLICEETIGIERHKQRCGKPGQRDREKEKC